MYRTKLLPAGIDLNLKQDLNNFAEILTNARVIFAVFTKLFKLANLQVSSVSLAPYDL
jgi:hypothetical protein